MKALARRLLAIERARAPAKFHQVLVLRQEQDTATELEAFRQAHGREPWRVFSVKRAPLRP